MLASRTGTGNRNGKSRRDSHDCDLDTPKRPVIVPRSQWNQTARVSRSNRVGGRDDPKGWSALADDATTLGTLKQAVRRFADERQWEPFHSPKNLAMALAAEAGELLEPFLWLECGESRQRINEPVFRQSVADEIADVAILLLNLSLATGIDLSDAVTSKMVRNGEKYPAGK